MPKVYSVSEITDKLSETIESEPTLQKVQVQGKVTAPIGAGYFFLKDGPGGKKLLRCSISDGIPPAGKKVVVGGQITLSPADSQYEVEGHLVNGNGAPVTGVAEITDRISNLVIGTSELQDIQIQGTITPTPHAHVWILHDDDDGACKLNVFIPNPDAINVPVAGNVCVQGKINIYPPRSRYLIEVTPIEDIIAPPCQCRGCQSCSSLEAECNRACDHPEYTLCRPCYEASPDREEEVVKEVETYFSNLNVKGFSPKTQHKIQIGGKNGIADVVLVKEDDGTEVFAAIAECKGAGYVGAGKDQLKSYLSATDTRFGVFANRANPECWKFYENRRRNEFKVIKITPDKFKEVVVSSAKIGDLRNKIGVLEDRIRELTRRNSAG